MATNQILFLNPEFSGSLRNQQEIEFEQSCRRSHAAIVSHRVRKHKLSSIQKNLQRRHPVKEQDRAEDQRLPITGLAQTHTAAVNCVALYHGDTASESRGLAFFRQRTAVEWSGWKDAEFWTTFIIQASFTSSALRHALVGLAACHESYEESSHDRKESLQQMGVTQGQKALKCLNQEYVTLSTSAILATYIGISAFAARLHPGAYAKIWTLQYELYDQLKTSRIGSLDEAYMQRYLEPIIERQSSRSAHFLDLSWNLARTPAEYFKQTTEVSVPNIFADLKHARDNLETLLHFATYEYKTKSRSTGRLTLATGLLMRKWYEALQMHRDTKASSEGIKQSLDILRAYAMMNIVMIQTMDTETEMVFDEHLDAYSELAKTFEQFVQFEKKSQRKAVNFGADGCFTTLIGHTATRWCREPSIRRKLIRLLYECNRAEGFETAETWGMVADNMRKIEEAGVHPQPTSCYDIPAANRVRMVRSLFYFEPSLLQIRYVRPDLQKGEAEEACFLQDSQSSSHLSSIYPFPEEQLTLLPDLDVGKDYFSWLDKRTNTYRTTKGSNFYFPLPRC